MIGGRQGRERSCIVDEPSGPGGLQFPREGVLTHFITFFQGVNY